MAKKKSTDVRHLCIGVRLRGDDDGHSLSLVSKNHCRIIIERHGSELIENVMTMLDSDRVLSRIEAAIAIEIEKLLSTIIEATATQIREQWSEEERLMRARCDWKPQEVDFLKETSIDTRWTPRDGT